MKRIVTSLIIVLLLASAAFAGDFTPNGVRQGDIVNHLVEAQNKILNYNPSNKAIAMNASDNSHISIVTAGPIVSNGVHYTVAAATGTDDVILTNSTVQAAGKTKLYMFVYDAANATTEAILGAVDDTDIKNIVVPSGHTPMGYVKVVTAGVATFTLGTTAFNASDVTSTFYNIACTPFKNNALSE